LKIKCVDSRVNVNILASTSVPFILTTVHVPNLALTHKKWITVYVLFSASIVMYIFACLLVNVQGYAYVLVMCGCVGGWPVFSY
jgi:hypothetical protein